MPFDEIQTEVMDSIGKAPVHKNTTVPSAGTPISVKLPNDEKILLALIKNNIFGARANDFNDVVYYDTEGNDPVAVGSTVGIGEYIYLPGPFTELKIDSNNDGTIAEIILWGDENETPT